MITSLLKAPLFCVNLKIFVGKLFKICNYQYFRVYSGTVFKLTTEQNSTEMETTKVPAATCRQQLVASGMSS